MRVYRDCNPGTAQMAPTLTVDIRDGNLSIDTGLVLGRTGPYPHELDTTGCIVVPQNVCIEFYEFSDTINLPPSPTGYSMSLDNCCRNGLITNIPNPKRTNYYWNTNIPPTAVADTNSSPMFLTPPPVLLCLNEPIDDTLYTQDLDGDSLHYELCQIYQYDNSAGAWAVPYISPFSSLNPMPALPQFSIDPVTGVLSGTPNQIGHYVVGICVTDYRNAAPLSTVRLDYEFNVTPCYSIAADILTQAEDSSLLCGGLTINFSQQSQGASKFYWDFGDTTTLTDTSHQANPTFTYPNPGTYNVTLIANMGDPCADTAVEQFEIALPYSPEFSGQGTYCFEDQPISLSSTGFYPSNATYSWDFGPFASPQTSNQKDPPPVTYGQGGNHIAKLTVNSGKCTFSKVDTIKVLDELISDILTIKEDSSQNCTGLDMRFVSESQGANSLRWDFGDPTTLADTAWGDTAFYTYPTQGIYELTLYAMQDGGRCVDSTTALFEVFPELNAQMDISGQFCFEAQDVDFEAHGSYPIGTKFRWEFGSLASQPVVKNPSATNISWQKPGVYPVSLTVKKAKCLSTVYDTISIPAWTVQVDAGSDQEIEYGDLLNLYGSLANQYYWFSNRPASIANPFARGTSVDVPTAGDTLKFYLRVTSANGCQGIDSLKVFVRPDLSEVDFNILTPNGDGRNDYLDLSAFMDGRECEFTVMNRWGSTVYNNNEYSNDWPGVDNANRPLPDGTYYYILFCDRQITKTGPITLIRER